MQKNDVLEFLGKIDAFLTENAEAKLAGEKFALNIFGKSALMLAGLEDSIGTTDIDSLVIEGRSAAPIPEITNLLEKKFGRDQVTVNGYYIQFVKPNAVTLPPNLKWVPLETKYTCLLPSYLEPHCAIASKLFSAYSNFPRKKDKQDIRLALDQKLVSLKKVCEIADELFASLEFDARGDRCEKVYEYIQELMDDYGAVPLNYSPD